ncbi:coiled-coil domain-containing protein 25-like isoform X2 [Malaya genurostris]|uniref:coiled-coil domain-containing protein 25-like isoform X2 n=1 Tax=Malaya genurostris TaxID=325434 RepID=UPI0026F3C483|nr:coiled-coil domain-containing protein 25-like isoform X2 [Malaya genurostris]
MCGSMWIKFHRRMCIYDCNRYVGPQSNKIFNSYYNLIGFQGQTLDDIPSVVLEDACQLVKANSINGNKMNNIDIVYTMWENLKKTPAMEVGQVSFHKDKEVRKMRVEKRVNEIVNRLNKTKREEHPDFRAEREWILTEYTE